MAQQFQNNAKMNALSEFKLRLLAPPSQGASKPATLSMGVYKNNPRLVVKTNVPNDKDYGKITAALDTFTFFTLLHVIRQVADGPVDNKLVVNNQNTFVAGRKFDNPIVTSKIVVGKDKDGVVFIAVTAKDRPMIKFEFGLNEWHFLTDAAGNQLSKGDQSVLYAKGWCTTAETLMPQILKEEYVEPDFNNNGGGGGGNRGGNNGGNNYNRGGGNNGGGGSGGGSTSDADDDLPF